MKMYKKSDLTIIDGMIITTDGTVIGIDRDIVAQANELETKLQQANYLLAQPKEQAAPSLDGFVRVSDKKRPEFTIETPHLDARMEETFKLMDELDGIESMKEANKYLGKFNLLVEFATKDYVLDSDSYVEVFDTPTLGNPLELTVDDIVVAVGLICGLVKADGEDVDQAIRLAVFAKDEDDQVD